MSTNAHQALNGHITLPRPQRNALFAAFALLKQDIQAAGKALQAAEQRAEEFQNILDRLEEEDSEEDPEETQHLPCGIDQESLSAPREENSSEEPSPEKENSSEEPSSEKENSSEEPSSEKENSSEEPSSEKENSSGEISQGELRVFFPDGKWQPPHRPTRGARKSFIHKAIGERSGMLHAWFGNAAIKSLFDFTQGASKKDTDRVLGQIANSIESGDIRWAGTKTASHSVQLRWLFPYLPPKFADSKEPSSASRLVPLMDLYRQLNDLCRERTTKAYETRLKNGYSAFHRSDEANEELDQFARQWFNEQMRQRAEQTPATPPPAEPAASPSPVRSPEETQAIALDPSQWTSMDDMPIVYHGVTLWPPEPDKINPITRTDAEIAYWLAFEYLVEVRRLRGKNPRIDAMDLRQKFKYLKKIPANDGVLRGLHRIANIVNNDIGTDAENRVPRFEVTMV